MDNYQNNLNEVAKGGGNYSRRVMEEMEDDIGHCRNCGANIKDVGLCSMCQIEEQEYKQDR